MDEEQRSKFDTDLFMPPPGEQPVIGPWSDEAMAETFPMDLPRRG